MDYLTAKEICMKWGITPRMVNYHCTAGRIKGAVKKGNLWLIPADAEKPIDRRHNENKKERFITVNIPDKINCLYDKGTEVAFENLQELEEISEHKNALYPYMNDFITMLKSDKYVIRVRGFKLLCKQAKWDVDNIIDGRIDEILTALHDEKPTAIRQMLQYLLFLVPYTKNLTDKIEKAVLSIDCSMFKDTIRPLIEKDIQALIEAIKLQYN